MTEPPPPQVTSKRSYAFAAILILLIANTAIFAVAFLHLQNQLANMETTLTEQNKEIENMETVLTEQKSEIQDLQNQIELLDT